MFYVFCAKLVLDDLFSHLIQFMEFAKVRSYVPDSLCESLNVFFLCDSVPLILPKNVYLYKHQLKMTSVRCIWMLVCNVHACVLSSFNSFVSIDWVCFSFLLCRFYGWAELKRTEYTYEKEDDDGIINNQRREYGIEWTRCNNTAELLFFIFSPCVSSIAFAKITRCSRLSVLMLRLAMLFSAEFRTEFCTCDIGMMYHVACTYLCISTCILFGRLSSYMLVIARHCLHAWQYFWVF